MSEFPPAPDLDARTDASHAPRTDATHDARPNAASNAATDAAPKTQLSHRQILIIFSGLMLGMFLSALDNTIVTTALPSIVGDLGGQSQVTWVVTSYLLTSTITILLWGKLSDIYGRKLMFQVSIASFLLASALVGLSNSMMFLVVARGLQGIGAGGIMSLAFAIIGDILSPRERGKYMGLMGSVFLFAMILGPLLGGLIVQHLHLFDVAPWRWVFYINLPLGIPALFIIQAVLKVPFAKQADQRIDWLGFALMAVGTSAIILGLIWAGQPASWDHSYNLRWLPGVGDAAPLGGPAPADGTAQWLGDYLILTLLAVGVVLTTAFVFSQAKAKNALLPLTLFTKRNYALGSVVSFVVGAAMFGAFVFLPTYLQISTGVSATQSGLLMLPLMFGMFPFMTVSGNLVSKTGKYKIWPVVGLPVGTAGLLWLSFITATTPLWFVGVGMFLLGAGIGMTMQVIVVAVQNVLEPRELGIGTSANTFMRQMGGVFGVGIFGAYYASRIIALVPKALAAAAPYPDIDKTPILAGFQVNPHVVHDYPEPLRAVITGGFADTIAHIFLFAAPVMLLGWFVVLFLKEIPLRSSRNVGGSAPTGGPPANGATASTSGVTQAPAAVTASPAATPSATWSANGANGYATARPSYASRPAVGLVASPPNARGVAASSTNGASGTNGANGAARARSTNGAAASRAPTAPVVRPRIGPGEVSTARRSSYELAEIQRRVDRMPDPRRR